jgi:hypothetical protein
VIEGLSTRLRKLKDALIVDDPSPSYSALDLMDGLGRTDDLPAAGISGLNPSRCQAKPSLRRDLEKTHTLQRMWGTGHRAPKVTVSYKVPPAGRGACKAPCSRLGSEARRVVRPHPGLPGPAGDLGSRF